MFSFHLFFPLVCQNLNANPLDDDYIAHVSYMFSFLRVKWLKVSDAKVTWTSTGTFKLSVWSMIKSFNLLRLSHPIRYGLRKSLRWVYLCLHIVSAVMERDNFDSSSSYTVELSMALFVAIIVFCRFVHSELSLFGDKSFADGKFSEK